MRVLVLCHSFNSLTQKLYGALLERGDEVSVEFDINDETLISAVQLFRPEVIVAPFLKRAIPSDVWQQIPCFIVHPGIAGDRGPSALDWAIMRGEKQWGVTVLEANDIWDGGPIWSEQRFNFKGQSKGQIYRHELADAAQKALFQALALYTQGKRPVSQLEYPGLTGQWHDPIKDSDRQINWQSQSTEEVLRRIASADGEPGALAPLAGQLWRVFDVRFEPVLKGEPGEILTCHNQSVCVATIDAAIWIGQLAPAERKLDEQGRKKLKLPAVQLLSSVVRDFPSSKQGGPQTIRSVRQGNSVFVYFQFYNGAMNVDHCRQLQKEIQRLSKEPIEQLILMGGDDFWSNGLDLNVIESAASPAEESLNNIEAMNDLCESIIRLEHVRVCSVMRGNAGAGGVFLALAADFVLLDDGVILNPHYKAMGNLYGSEYWTYLLPKRLDSESIQALMQNRLPMSAKMALHIGLVDAALPLSESQNVESDVLTWLSQYPLEAFLAEKQVQRKTDEQQKPLSQYRAEEMEKMNLNFFGFDPSFHVARYQFVHKTPKSRTPLYLARHRRLEFAAE